MYKLDHLLWEDINLEQAEQHFAELTGATPAYGGRHAGGETHNSLLALGGNRYLELIALDPAHPDTEARLAKVTTAFRSGLMAFGMSAQNLDDVEALIKQAGLSVAGRHEVSRQTLGGGTLTWQSLMLGGHNFGHYLPFFTQLTNGTHPSETAPQGGELLEFSVRHPESEELSRLYKVLQIDIPVFHATKPQMKATLATPRGEVVLRSWSETIE